MSFFQKQKIINQFANFIIHQIWIEKHKKSENYFFDQKVIFLTNITESQYVICSKSGVMFTKFSVYSPTAKFIITSTENFHNRLVANGRFILRSHTAECMYYQS